jgi:hypothetical protein
MAAIPAAETVDNEGEKRGFPPRCGNQPKINKLIFLDFLVSKH